MAGAEFLVGCGDSPAMVGVGMYCCFQQQHIPNHHNGVYSAMAKASIGNVGRSRKPTAFQAYKIICLDNGKAYIGITVQGYVTRFSQHIRRPFAVYRGGEYDTHISRAIRHHGATAFSVQHIASATTFDDLLALEILLIAQHQTVWPIGYNRTLGGEGCLGVSRPVSEQQKADIRKALRGRKLPVAQRVNIGIGLKAAWARGDRLPSRPRAAEQRIRGVRRTRTGMWTSAVMVNGENHNLGTFDTAEEAAAARASFLARPEIIAIRRSGYGSPDPGHLRGTERQKSGRWGASVSVVIRNGDGSSSYASRRFGSFGSAEEAHAAYLMASSYGR